MTLPVLFQRLVDEDGWEVLRSCSNSMDEAYTISNEVLNFQASKAKDTDFRFFAAPAKIGTKNGGRLMNPCKLAARMGLNANSEFEAFEFIAKQPEQAIRELGKFRVRSLYLEPILLLPVLPLLVLAVIPLIRNRILGIVGLWTEGPVRRLVD